ncbi:MAG: hypothetical protein NVSMB68_00720 [Thermoanaerobaculia bacterium]
MAAPVSTSTTTYSGDTDQHSGFNWGLLGLLGLLGLFGMGGRGRVDRVDTVQTREVRTDTTTRP